ncbi:hypothetical protein [Bradyrhizobium sp. CB3481]|uniref:hypothetical protein n=1 Tax=Bradyrhizobium sp. CB3481 TaxID=3039158 RepID=UPI0024B1BF76|nr:hypothetical protein [Bradyrhizobium sp. CB3481]WFU15496.1 hypothetical protein QA643_31655 [Bradyrhizobium sp. CB3481]
MVGAFVPEVTPAAGGQGRPTKICAEDVEAYLHRKHRELRLINDCLHHPLPLSCPRSVSDVIRHKFQLTAALKAEHALHDWTVTETAWAHQGQRRIGPFAFRYDYQRADLDVRGPSFYDLQGSAIDTVYTASGMAAISALLLALAGVIGKADILVLPGAYGETQELIEGYVERFRMITLNCSSTGAAVSKSASPRVLLLDSSASAPAFDAGLRQIDAAPDLLIFDTTCLSTGSGRIRRVLGLAQEFSIPVVMVRSHTKLDSLGAEYGRLGSVTFVDWERNVSCGSKLKELPAEVRNAIRLLGGAALPAHFPPYIGTPLYRELTDKRIAAILRNGRRASRYFAAALPGLTAELHYVHGLYLTLSTRQKLDEASARCAAAKMSRDLAEAGLPIQHAGSFGFDFVATEWFHNPTTGRYSVRIAVPDLPTAIWDDLVDAIAKWWSAHQWAGGSRS